jgi:hypothetical protein
VVFLLLKFAYQDFLDDRRFKNTTKTNIKNYEMILGKFVDYCIENEVVNAGYTVFFFDLIGFNNNQRIIKRIRKIK